MLNEVEHFNQKTVMLFCEVKKMLFLTLDLNVLHQITKNFLRSQSFSALRASFYKHFNSKPAILMN